MLHVNSLKLKGFRAECSVCSGILRLLRPVPPDRARRQTRPAAGPSRRSARPPRRLKRRSACGPAGLDL